MSTAPEPLALDLLLSEDQRRPLTVAGHHAFRESLSASRPFDEIDAFLEEQQDAQDAMSDPYAGDPPNRRSDKELGRLLDLLDSLDERGNG
jgi:hypothetical protein